MDGLQQQFLAEASELLEELEATALELEQSPHDRKLVDRAFRAMHTLKGSSGMAGFDGVSSFTHELESALDRVRSGEITISDEFVSLILAAADHVTRTLEGSEEPQALRDRERTILRDVTALVERALAGDGPAAPPPAAVEVEAPKRFAVTFRPRHFLLPLGLDPMLLVDEVADMGDSKVTLVGLEAPPIEEMPLEDLFFEWRIVLDTKHDKKALQDVFIFVEDEVEPTVEEIATEAPAPVAPAPVVAPAAPTPPPAPTRSATPPPAAKNPAASNDAKMVRVPAEKLDRLVDLVGELVIAQARLSDLAMREDSEALISIAEDIGHFTTELRDSAMEIRMLPVGSTFARFRRLVRDVSRSLNKRVEMVTEGDEVELDKNLIDRINEPLIHLIRNSLDHGLESPEDREAAGKSPSGTVTIRAEHVAGNVVLTISDDGRGIDVERLREKAAAKGLLPDPENATEAELIDLIFHAGMSTAKKVTDLSGRGVGLDVVRSTIASLRGRIDVRSVRGEGTSFVITLPLTLAIIEGLLIELAGGKYVVPLASVEECLEFRTDSRRVARPRGVIDVRGQTVPYLRLREELGVDGAKRETEHVVIAHRGNDRIGLVVDEVLGQHQTVVKTMGRLFERSQELSGATILGDGTVALILDIAALLDRVRALGDHERGAVAA